MTEQCFRPVPVALSPLEEARFGIRTARAMVLSMDDLPQVMDFCHAENVRLLISRCSTRDLSVAQAMERFGFSLMDTLVCFRRTLENLPERPDVTVRPATGADIETVRAIARAAFHGYDGHYHADPRLDRAACDDLYEDWAARSCTLADLADEVLLAEVDGESAGFLTLKALEDGDADGRLYAVVPHAQGRGIGQALVREGLYWSQAEALLGMVISTQVTNIASQVSWVRVGFAPHGSFYTFHKWFDEE
ncbi:MAG: GNAT family N-acetyltransferase [Chloroflexi bacterium]|nr:GNAT family N-acetyltransferase [Chloroflexota bacterium]